VAWPLCSARPCRPVLCIRCFWRASRAWQVAGGLSALCKLRRLQRYSHDLWTQRQRPPDRTTDVHIFPQVRRHLVTAEGEVQMPRSPGYPLTTLNSRPSMPTHPARCAGRQTRAARRLGARSARLRAHPARSAPSAAPAAAASAQAAWPRAPSGTPPLRRCLRSRARAREGVRTLFCYAQGKPGAHSK
jgi:hypothetical protein